ncbi:uncharacterized protein CIMG_01536 [Coccidioides immitis RS]|uniref:Gfo/Idh/MocA-like oxidoreductase N-terminal domain-containing protein n=3 Tax=Coccidioides immitis TaxID=5501 RepID=J3KJE5_COCIM|nr:uncharacterized protein CIMG_01536 [Coccidioides immitis RS]EAS36182.3 hypothetical protein CIMG_01536 [Coccidioides immitis RS]KMP01507.1 SpcB [Coccidioides immitis RMSCC 2394]KMU88947.1 SpcB [Coccidioides immitis H538.4]
MTTTTFGQPGRILRVGVIGCGEVSQVVHIPNLILLSDYFRITYVCDISFSTITHCKTKFASHDFRITTNAEEVCSSKNVDVVFICSSDEYHVPHVVAGLRHGKFVFVEKPMALCLRDVDLILEAEDMSPGGRVMVGYMRRYASVFMDAVREIGSLGEVCYGRVRDIVGQNSTFVAQSGTFPKRFGDWDPRNVRAMKDIMEDIFEQALRNELELPVTPQLMTMWRHLGSLGSHDLSAMRETFGGMPLTVLGASLCPAAGPPFWNAIFQYPNFTVSYESGIDHVPRFDASIEIFGKCKTIKVCYDAPYIKGLPVTMQIKEALPDGSYRESTVRKTYEDPYVLEMKELYECVVYEKEVKTSALDARREIEMFGMVLKAAVQAQDQMKKIAQTGV